MKITRIVALLAALVIPGIALADSPHCCKTASSCCPGCPWCNHAK